MEKIKWGIISTGRIANDFASDFKYVKSGELVGVASRGFERAKEFAKRHSVPKAYGSYEELFADPDIDAVYVATPHTFHLENSIAGLQAGKAVLCEKPITIHGKEFEKLREVAESSGCYLMEGLWTYFLPATIQAKSWADSGRIGEIKYIKMDFGFAAPYEPKGRLFNPELAGGGLLDIGIYTLAIPWFFTGKTPVIHQVEAKLAPTGVDEDVLVDMHHGDCRTSMHFSLKYTLPTEALIIGTQGFIRIKDFYKASESYLFDAGGVLSEQYQDSRKSVGFNYEIDAVSQDLLAGLKESKVMPLAFSQALQSQMDEIRSLF